MLPSLLGNCDQQTSSSFYELQRKSDVQYNSNSNVYSTSSIQQSSLSCYWCLDNNCKYNQNYGLPFSSQFSTGINSQTSTGTFLLFSLLVITIIIYLFPLSFMNFNSTAYKASMEISIQQQQKQTSTDAQTNSTLVSNKISSTSQAQPCILPPFLDWTSHLSKVSSTYPTYTLPAFQNWTSHVPMTHSPPLDVDSQASLESYTLPPTPMSMTSSEATTSCDDNFLDNLVYDVSVTLPDINYPVPVLPIDNSIPYKPLLQGTFTVLETKNQTPTKSKNVGCKCPNCLAPGGNNTFGADGQMQHNCHFPNCKKVFSKATSLKAHLKRHNIDNRPVCKICDRSFARIDNLTRHMRLHFRDKHFVCPHCFDDFQRKDHLMKHMRNVHENPKKKRGKKDDTLPQCWFECLWKWEFK